MRISSVKTAEGIKVHDRSIWTQLLKKKGLLTMALPGLLYIFIFNYLPMFGVVIAFQDFNYRDGFFGSKLIGFKNFQFFFASQDAQRVITNTILLNILFIVTSLLVTVSFAIILNELLNRYFVKTVQTLMFLPHFLSYVIVGFFGLAFFSHDLGMLNKILEYFGKESVLWYNQPEYWRFILTAINLWKGLGMGTIIYLAAILNISKDYYDAAEVDGAGKIKQIIHITLPMLLPIICILTLLSIGGMMRGNYDLIYNLTANSGSLYVTTDVIDTYVIRALRQLGDLGMSSAAGLFQSIAGFILVTASNTIVRKINPEYALF